MKNLTEFLNENKNAKVEDFERYIVATVKSEKFYRCKSGECISLKKAKYMIFNADGQPLWGNCINSREAKKLINELATQGKKASIGYPAPDPEKVLFNSGYVGVYLNKESEN